MLVHLLIAHVHESLSWLSRLFIVPLVRSACIKRSGCPRSANRNAVQAVHTPHFSKICSHIVFTTTEYSRNLC